LVVPNRWGGIIARPGAMKTYAITEALKPVSQLEALARQEYEAQANQVEAHKDRILSEIDYIKTEMKKASKTGEGLDDLEAKLARKKANLTEAQAFEQRYVVQDPTVAKLGEILSRNPRGLLLLRDELAGWLKTLEADGHEGDREFYLESWNGTGSFTVDRVKRGTVRIEGLCLSIVGGIQPGKLGAYIERAIRGLEGADGLLQRLQVVVWPDGLTKWKKPTSRPNDQARERAFQVFDRLDSMNFAPEHEGETPHKRFDPEAQSLFDAWRDELETRIRGDELRDSPAFEAHLSKYRSLMPSLALLFHLIHDGSQNVCFECARLAAGWCEYLEHHARKIYSEELQPGAAGAHILANKIKQGAVQDGDSVRDIYRHHWSELTNPKSVCAAVVVLSEASWVRVENFQTGGRNAEVIRLHPELGGKADE